MPEGRKSFEAEDWKTTALGTESVFFVSVKFPG
jgi:hypothetical protein